MVLTSVAPIEWALVRQLRSNVVLKGALKGDINRGFAPQKTAYPFIVYSLHYAPNRYTWGGVVTEAGFDVVVFATDEGVADSIAQLINQTLADAKLLVDGQTSLMCRPRSAISITDIDDQGLRYFEKGFVVDIWTSQQLPTAGSLTFTADSTLA